MKLFARLLEDHYEIAHASDQHLTAIRAAHRADGAKTRGDEREYHSNMVDFHDARTSHHNFMAKHHEESGNRDLSKRHKQLVTKHTNEKREHIRALGRLELGGSK